MIVNQPRSTDNSPVLKTKEETNTEVGESRGETFEATLKTGELHQDGERTDREGGVDHNRGKSNLTHKYNRSKSADYRDNDLDNWFRVLGKEKGRQREVEPEDMADSNIAAPTFSGRRNEDVQDFRREFEAYVIYKKLQEEQAFCLLRIILKDKARDFYIAYVAEIEQEDGREQDEVTGGSKGGDNSSRVFGRERKGVQHFLQALEKHFKLQQTMWTQGAQLMNTKQQENETFEEYVITLQKLARKVNFEEDKLKMIILHGALPKIKNAIMMVGGVESIKEMERIAALVESTTESSKSSLEQAIKRVEMKVDAMNVTMIGGREEEFLCAVEGDRTRRSATTPKPQELPGDNWQGNRQGYQERNQGRQYQNQYRTNSQNVWQGGQQMGQQRQESTQGEGWGQDNRGRPRNQYGQGGNRGQYGGNQRNNQRGQPGRIPQYRDMPWDCPTCGDQALHVHTGNGSCPAAQMQCYSCQQVGHLKRCCQYNNQQRGPPGPPSGGQGQA